MEKIYDFFRYDLPSFFKNIWRFKKELLYFRPWDYAYNLEFLKKSFELTEKNIRLYGLEEEESKNKRLRNLREVIRLLDYNLNSKYFDEAERFGLRNSEMKIIPINDTFSKIEIKDPDNFHSMSKELEERNWNKLWELIKTDMRGWWD